MPISLTPFIDLFFALGALLWMTSPEQIKRMKSLLKPLVAPGLLHPAGEQVLFDFVMCFYVL